MDAIEGIISSFSPQEKEEAQKIEVRIQEVSGAIKADKERLESNFVRLSQLIDEVRAKKYWLLGNYKTFGDYLADLWNLTFSIITEIILAVIGKDQWFSRRTQETLAKGG